VKGSGGGRRWQRQRSFFFSPLLRCAVFFLCFSFSLSTRFLLSLQWMCDLPPVRSGSQWRGEARRQLRRFFFLPRVCCLCQQRPPLSILFLLPLSSRSSVSVVAAVVDGAVGGGGVVVAAMRQADGVCCSLFSSPPCRGASLCFSVFFFLSLLCLFFYFWTMMVLSGVTGRNGGGDGGSYADRSRWFFLSSPLFLCWFRLFFSVLSLSLHPQNSPVRSSFSHQKFPPESVVCFSPSPKFCPPFCWFLLWYL